MWYTMKKIEVEIMKNKRLLKTVSSLLIIVLLLTLFPTYADAAKKKSKGYLLLVENENGTWTNYSGVSTIKKVDGTICVNPQKVSNYLGLKYTQVSELKFTIANEKKKSSFTLGSNKYKFFDGKKTVNRTSKVKITGKVHYSDFNGLVKGYKYFKGTDAPEYKKLGYTGVLCISKYGKVTKLPSTNKIVDTDGNKVFGNKDNVTTNGYIKLEGVEIPALEKFNKTDITKDTWTNKAIVKAVDELGDVLGSKIAKAEHDEEYSSIIVQGTVVTFYIGSFSAPQLTMTKDEDNNAYKITLNASLSYSDKVDNKVGIDAMRTALKAMCAMIVSGDDVNSLYDVIYQSAENDSNYKGINDNSYITVNGFKIKYKLDKVNQSVNYYIKAK